MTFGSRSEFGSTDDVNAVSFSEHFSAICNFQHHIRKKGIKL